MSIESDVQRAYVGDRIELIEVDASVFGGGVHRFVRDTDSGQPVLWQGNLYMPLAYVAEGFETNGQGRLPRPKMLVCHLNTSLIALVKMYDDLLGAVVIRWRTFKDYLDNGPQADPNVHFPPDVYVIDQKVDQDDQSIEWELAASIDQEGKKLPGRQVTRDACPWRYRKWTGEAFDYDKVLCPYDGNEYFDDLGNACAASEDKCGKRKSDCKLRFGTAALPFGGFTGVGRARR